MKRLKEENGEYEELETKVKRYRKYKSLQNLSVYLLVLFYVPPLLVIVVISQVFGVIPNILVFWIAVSGLVVLSFIGLRLSERGMKKYKLREDEWAIFYLQIILRELSKYRKTKNEDLRRGHRREALKGLNQFISAIESRWVVGPFYLAKNIFEKPISDLKENLRHRVAVILSEGTDEAIANVEQIMTNFLFEAKNLNLDGIQKINEQISTRLAVKEIQILGQEHPSLSEQLTTYLNTHRVTTNVLFVVSLIIGCMFFYYAVTTYLGIVKEYSFAGSVAIFVGLLTIYFTKRGKV